MALVVPGDEEARVFLKDEYFTRTGYQPHDAQKIVHYNNTRHRALSNGRRWGKTLLGGKEGECMAYIKNYLGQPMQGWIIGPEYIDAEKEFRVVYNSLRALGIDQVSTKFLHNVENGNMRIHTKWGFDIQCRSAKHPDTLVGEGLDFVIIVEAGRHHRRMFTEYVRPALSDKRGWSLMTGVPEMATGTSLLYWAFERGKDPSKTQWASWQMPSWTNNIVFPGGRRDPEILEAEDDLTEDEFQRQYGGEFVERTGRVMKEWDKTVHVQDLEYNRKWPLYAAVDYGYTNDWVWLWIQVDPFNNIYVIGEHRWRLMDTEEIAREEMLGNSEFATMLRYLTCIYAPPSEPSDTNVLRRVLNKPIRTNTGGELNDRNKLTRSFLKQRPAHLPDGHPEKRPQLVVDQSCTMLQWEMATGYRWPENKNEARNDSENPVDKDDHGPEALGRFVKGHMEKTVPQRQSRQSKVKTRREYA